MSLKYGAANKADDAERDFKEVSSRVAGSEQLPTEAVVRPIVGERPMNTVNGQRGENLTLILSVSPQNDMEKHIFHVGGTITAAKFGEFFASLEETVELQTPCIFILDNTPCH